MTYEEWVLVAVGVGTVGLMFGTRLRSDVVAMLAALSLDLLGVIPHGGVFDGLSSTVVLTLIGLFILAEGLEDTGVVRWMAGRLTSLGGSDEQRLLLTLMVSAALLSVAMNNVAVGALFLPASARIARTARMPVSELLLPISYAALLGGMATIFTSANIIMSDLLVQQGSAPLRMIDFASTGGLIAFLGIGYMLLVGRRLLPERSGDSEVTESDLFGLYELGERFWEIVVGPDSPLAGKTIEEIGFRGRFGLSVLAVRRRHRTFLVPGPGIAVVPGDHLLMLGRKERLVELLGGEDRLPADLPEDALHDELELTEVVVPPRSRAVGRTLTELRLRSRYGLTVLALWRGGQVLRTDVGTTPLQVGDGLLVVNIPRRIDTLTRGGDFLQVGGRLAAPARPERAPVSVAIFAAMMLAVFAGPLPLGETVFAGAMLMVLSGCVTMEQAYRAIQWHVIFFVAGLLPLGFALIDTGLADRIATFFTGFAAGGQPMVAVVTMYLVTVAATQLVGGQVSALLVGPVALAVAQTGGLTAQAMAVAVAIGASTAFLTPIAHPVNAMIMGTGGYRPRHFFQVGLGMTLASLVGLVLSMWLFWGIPLPV